MRALPQPGFLPFSQLQQDHQPEYRHLQRAVLSSLWVHLQLQARGYHSMSWSRCWPSPRRPGSRRTSTGPGGEQLSLGREQLPVLAPPVRGAVYPSTAYKTFPACVFSLNEGSPGPSWAPETGSSSEVVGSLPKVTLPSAFSENGRLDALISKAPPRAPGS